MWFALHKKQINITKQNIEKEDEKEIKTDINETKLEENLESPSFQVYEIIKKLDKGEGANYEEVIQEINSFIRHILFI